MLFIPNSTILQRVTVLSTAGTAAISGASTSGAIITGAVDNSDGAAISSRRVNSQFNRDDAGVIRKSGLNESGLGLKSWTQEL